MNNPEIDEIERQFRQAMRSIKHKDYQDFVTELAKCPNINYQLVFL